MRVNGELADVAMKLGDAGEAFFVMRTENFVPEDLRTSPLALAPHDDQLIGDDKQPNAGKMQDLRLASPLLGVKTSDAIMTQSKRDGFSSPYDAANFDFDKEMA